MNKIIKRILIGIIIIAMLGIYITVDCIKLKNSEVMTKPIITLKEKDGRNERGEHYIEYTRIGI